jgi:dihydroneopterin aldolase
MSPRRPRSASAARRGSASGPGPGYDWLRLHGIQAYGHLGVTQKERELGQRLEADVEIAYAREVKRRRPDTIDSFVDYEELSRVVRGQIAMARCRLLETLAEELALALLAEFDPPRVRVRLRKMHVPVADFSGLPEVEVERVR